jgi:hypothetical protein
MSDDADICMMAYLVWLCEGCPDGRDLQHWEIALKLTESAALAADRESASNAPTLCPCDRCLGQGRQRFLTWKFRSSSYNCILAFYSVTGWVMRKRGERYWAWASADLHVRNHDERVGAQALINIQARHSAKAGTQLFIGAYGEKGIMLFEEVYDSRPGESMTQAMEWGLTRARSLLDAAKPSHSAVHDPLPRRRARQHI